MERKAQTHWQEEIQDVEVQSWIGERVQGRNQSFIGEIRTYFDWH